MTEQEMPKFQSHKKVCALKVAGIEFRKDGSATIAPAEKGFAPLNTAPNFRERFKGSESDLGYYVVYEGGYESWSPSDAFESGYTLLE